MYGLSQDDLALQDTARAFTEELIPYEVEAEMNERRATRRHRREAEGARDPARAVRHQHPDGAGRPGLHVQFSRCSSRSRVAGSPTRSAGSSALPRCGGSRWQPRTSASAGCCPTVRGEMSECYAITEEFAGSDVAALEATARRDGDDYVLNGVKWHVTSYNDAVLRVLPGGPDRRPQRWRARPVRRRHPDPRLAGGSDSCVLAHVQPPPPDRRLRGRARAGVAPGRQRRRRHDVRLRVVPFRAVDGRRSLPRSRRPPRRGDDGIRAEPDHRRPSR